MYHIVTGSVTKGRREDTQTARGRTKQIPVESIGTSRYAKDWAWIRRFDVSCGWVVVFCKQDELLS